MKKILNGIVLLFMLINLAYAEEKTTAIGRVFIKPGFTARAMALGEAFTGLSDDLNAANYNPAGLTQVGSRQFSIMHLRYFENIYQEYTGYVHPLKTLDVVGISFVFLHMDDIIERNEFGSEINRYRNYDLATTLSYAYPINNLSIGFNAKYLTQHYGTISNTGTGFDIGLLYNCQPWRFGLVYQNLGKEVIFKEVGNVFPSQFRIGIGYEWQGIITLLDVEKPKDEDTKYNLGVEYWLLDKRIAFRAGGMFSKKESDFVGGCGAKLGYAQVDYAYLRKDELDKKHRVSATVKF